MANKVRVEIPLQDGVALVIDADKICDKGFRVEEKFVYHCRDYTAVVSFLPVTPSVERES